MALSSSFSLFRAEWQKISGNRMVAAFLIWIFPIGAFAVMTLFCLAALFSDSFRATQIETGIEPWNETMVGVWSIINNIVGRWIIIAFTAFAFAGEYRHGTWKNLVMHRSRARLILNKFITLAVYVTVSFVITSIIAGVGAGIAASILDLDYGLSNSGEVMGQFLEDYSLQMLTTLTATLISASFAAAAAMITRNVMASVFVGIFFYMLEFFAVIILMGLIDWILGINLAGLYRFLPSYNLDNIVYWIEFSEPREFELLGKELVAFDLLPSMLLVGLWVVLLVGLSILAFIRQDITS